MKTSHQNPPQIQEGPKTGATPDHGRQEPVLVVPAYLGKVSRKASPLGLKAHRRSRPEPLPNLEANSHDPRGFGAVE